MADFMKLKINLDLPNENGLTGYRQGGKSNDGHSVPMSSLDQVTKPKVGGIQETSWWWNSSNSHSTFFKTPKSAVDYPKFY